MGPQVAMHRYLPHFLVTCKGGFLLFQSVKFGRNTKASHQHEICHYCAFSGRLKPVACHLLYRPSTIVLSQEGQICVALEVGLWGSNPANSLPLLIDREWPIHWY